MEVEATLPPAQRGVRGRDVAAMFLLCALSDVILWHGSGGLGHGVLLVAVPVVLLAVAEQRRRSARLAAVAVLLALLALRSIWQASAGGLALGGALLVAFAVALRTAGSYLPELLLSAGVTFVRALGGLAGYAFAAGRALTPRRLSGRAWAHVAVPVAVVGVFVAVFAAANPVISRLLDRLWGAFGTGGSLLPSAPHVGFWLLSAYAAVFLLGVHVLRPSLNDRLGPGHALVPIAADAARDTRWLMSRNVLLAVNVLFLAYNAVDAVYLWAGQPPAGVAHTDYAHRGATWLTIGLALSTIVIGVIFRGSAYQGDNARRLERLAFLWAAQNLVLAAGTLRRIQLYIDYSGLTNLRIVGILGSLLVVAGLVLIVIKVARARTMLWLLRRQLDALGLALALFVIAPTDAWVTSFNVARIQRHQYRPLLHLFEQEISPEGLPGLLPLLDSDDPVVSRGVAFLLLGRHDELRADQRAAGSRWTGWEGSRAWALGHLAGARPKIDSLITSMAPGAADSLADLRALARRVNDTDERD